MDIIVGGIILLILGSSGSYVVKQLRKGNHCIGCSHSEGCCGSCHSSEDS